MTPAEQHVVEAFEGEESYTANLSRYDQIVLRQNIHFDRIRRKPLLKKQHKFYLNTKGKHYEIDN